MLKINGQTLVKGAFTIDGCAGPVEGWYDPSVQWNGFACPYFDEDTTHQLLDDLNGDQEGPYFFEYIGHGSVWYIDEEGEREEIATAVLGTYEGGVTAHFFQVGAYNWTWEAVDPDASDN